MDVDEGKLRGRVQWLERARGGEIERGSCR